MATISKPYTFSSGATIVAAEHNSNFDTIYNDYNGNITNVNLSASAAIGYSKLNLAGGIVNADVNSSAAIAYSKLNLAASITRTDIATGYGLVPTGAILMWSGTIATIPTGWALCDGSNSTPDLRDFFIVGAKQDDSGVAKSNITGSLLQTSDGVVKNHVHPVKTSNTTGGATTYVRVGVAAQQDTSQDTDNPTGGNQYNIARFYALAFIMKT